jgi:hypothetical protein
MSWKASASVSEEVDDSGGTCSPVGSRAGAVGWTLVAVGALTELEPFRAAKDGRRREGLRRATPVLPSQPNVRRAAFPSSAEC